MKQSRGFTLLEILLVLVLLSVSSVAVIATLPLSQKDEARAVAQSLFQRIQLLNEEAILSGRDFGLRVDEQTSQLRFLILTAEGWQKLEKNQFNSELKVDPTLTLSFRLGGDAWLKDDRLFEPSSLFDEELFAEEKKELPPQIFILSSGEVTTFSIDITPKTQASNSSDIKDRWQILVEDNGQIRLLAPGEQNEKA